MGVSQINFIACRLVYFLNKPKGLFKNLSGGKDDVDGRKRWRGSKW